MVSYVKVDFKKEGIDYFKLRNTIVNNCRVEINAIALKRESATIFKRWFLKSDYKHAIQWHARLRNQDLTRLSRIFDLAEFGPVYLSGEDLKFINKYREIE